jgi:hypothetical protein
MGDAAEESLGDGNAQTKTGSALARAGKAIAAIAGEEKSQADNSRKDSEAIGGFELASQSLGLFRLLGRS